MILNVCVSSFCFGVFCPSRPQTEMQALLGLCGTTSLMSQTSKTQLHTYTHLHIVNQSTHTHTRINFSFIWPLVNNCTTLFLAHSITRDS